jgi:dihydroorotate dehydrogenase (fumarate)
MPNGGMAFYKTELPKMTQKIHEAKKVAILSIAGFSNKEYVQLAELADVSGVDMIEVNFGCPNVSIEGRQKPIVSFDPETMQEIIEAVQAVTDLPLAIKLSPYSNPADLQAAAMVLTELEVAAVVASNTFPNGFYGDEKGGSVLANELAGVSGKALLAINLGQVKQFRAALPESIRIIGVGGVETPEAAQLYFQAGADVVQAATLIVRDGYDALDTLIEQNGL